MPTTPEIFEPLDQDDQTPGYELDGTPLTADDVIFQLIPDASDPTSIRMDGLVAGETRNYHQKGNPLPKATQPRQGQIAIERDDGTQTTRAVAHHPSSHPEPQAVIPQQKAARVIDPVEERRKFATALHDKHTLANWPELSPEQGNPRINQLSKLTLEGTFTKIGDEWRIELDGIQAQEEEKNKPPEPIMLGDKELPWIV